MHSPMWDRDLAQMPPAVLGVETVLCWGPRARATSCPGRASRAIVAPFAGALPRSGLRPRSPADGRVNPLLPNTPARCSAGEVLQGLLPSPPPPCPLPGGVVAHVISGTVSKQRWCVLLSFGDEVVSPPRSQRCRCLLAPRLLRVPSTRPMLSPLLLSLKLLRAAQQGSPGGSLVPGSDTEPRARPWATSLTLPLPQTFGG